jgi:hypothetical protein
MSVSRRTRLSLLAAAASGALVVTMAGTALASDHDRSSCSDLDLQDAQAALDTVAPSERLRLADLCEVIPTLHSDDDTDADDSTPETTPAAVPDEEGADEERADENDGDQNDAEDSDGDNNKKKSDGEKDGEEGGAATGGDRDCADFDSQADAQAALEEKPGDPERLDADDDGIACENHFDTEGQQVAVYPKGGVATGGAALS